MFWVFFLLFPAWGTRAEFGAPATGCPARCGAAGPGGLGGGHPRFPQPLGSAARWVSSPGAKPGEEPAGDSPKAENEPLHGSGICKWFNVRMGFGFLSMTAKGGATLDSPVDVFVHQVWGRILRWVLGREGGAAPDTLPPPPGRMRGGRGTSTPLPREVMASPHPIPREVMASPIPARYPGKTEGSPPPPTPRARFPRARRVAKGRHSRSPGLLSGDRPCKLIPERFYFPIMVPWGAPRGRIQGSRCPRG